MIYRRFGKTELELPVISCGGMRYQHSWNGDDPVPEESQKNLEACIRRSLELGIHHIETARGYGTSEVQLGKILPTLPRDKILVQTKVGPESDVKKFVENFEKSMQLLHMDYLDLFSIHGINNQACLDDTMRCLDKALKWKKQGRIRHLGFASHGTSDILIKAIRTGAFEYVNLHWFYIYQDNWPAIVEARKHDMGVFIISPNDKGGLLYQPSAKLCELTAPLHPMAFNDLFCLSRPEVHTLSCGVSRPGDFDIHAGAVEKLGQAGTLLPPIVKRLEEEMVRVFGAKWVKTWDQGLPHWSHTPGRINIPWVLRLRNLALAYDMIEFGKMRYNLLGNGGHWFPGNRAIDIDRAALRECLHESPNASKIPQALDETHALLAGEEKKRLQQDE